MAPRRRQDPALARRRLKMPVHRLTLALVTETYPPEINGVAMTLGRLVDGCTARGHRVRIVRPRQKHERDIPVPDAHLLTPGLPLPRYPELRFGLPAWGALERSWRDEMPDIVHVATEGPLGFAALSVARRLNIPVVSTFHTNFHTYTRHYGVGWLHGSIERYLRWFHNRTDATLVPTAAMAADLEQRRFRSVGILSRGVDTRLFNPSRRSAALRANWGANEGDLVCMVVGRLAPEKNLKLALAAHAAICEDYLAARLVLVGDGPLKATLARTYPDCHFAGSRRGEELAAHYASADLFLFPSQTETFGNVVSEALASGLPVAAFDLAAAGDLVENGRNGRLATPGDAAGFIAAARQLARDILDNPTLRDAGPASVGHLDWECIHDRYAGVLAAVIERHRAARCVDAQTRFVPD